MPKRILDGEAMWGSSKIAALPEWAKAEYSWIFSLALANGSFECDVRTVWSKCYLYSRPEVTTDQVKMILDAFERVGLLFRWVHHGKQWGYWVGINKEGRLPPPTQRARMARGQEPPTKGLKAFISTRPVLGQVQHGLVGLGLVGFGNTKSSQDQLFVDGEPQKAAAAPSTPGLSDVRDSGQERDAEQFAYCTAHLKITLEDHEKLQKLFPVFDVKSYYPEMDFWLDQKKELRPNSALFARNWLKREAEKIDGSAARNESALDIEAIRRSPR